MTESAARPGDLVFVGDVHLEEGDADLGAFLGFLDRIGERASRLVFMGDLFNLWIGRRELERPHHSAVVERLTALRNNGLVVRYIEGNRDYRIGPCYAGTAVDEATAEAIVEEFGGRRLVAVHGDLTNPADRQYRTWRRFSRSAAAWGLFHVLPRARRAALADSLERRMRSSNLEFKRAFPEKEARAYAAAMLGAGDDALVLGHFHVEKDIELEIAGRRQRVLVLPEWKGSRRHLRVGGDGTIEFVDSPR